MVVEFNPVPGELQINSRYSGTNLPESDLLSTYKSVYNKPDKNHDVVMKKRTDLVNKTFSKELELEDKSNSLTISEENNHDSISNSNNNMSLDSSVNVDEFSGDFHVWGEKDRSLERTQIQAANIRSRFTLCFNIYVLIIFYSYIFNQIHIVCI